MNSTLDILTVDLCEKTRILSRVYRPQEVKVLHIITRTVRVISSVFGGVCTALRGGDGGQISSVARRNVIASCLVVAFPIH